MHRSVLVCPVLILVLAGCEDGKGSSAPGADRGLDALAGWSELPVLDDLRYHQFSSNDREYREYPNVDSGNKDNNNFIRVCGERPEMELQEVDDTDCEPGIEGYVIADDEGPGFISRMWFTMSYLIAATGLDVSDEKIRIYVDDLTAPAYEAPLGGWVSGDGPFPFDPPFTGPTSGSLVSYFPVSYQSRLLVVLDELDPAKLYYYQVDVQHTGDRTLPFDLQTLDRERIDEIAAQLGGSDRQASGVQPLLDGSVTLPAGGAASLFEHTGSATIRQLRLELDGVSAAEQDEIAFEARWDGAAEAAIDVPLGAFFGQHRILSAFETLPMRVEVEGSLVRLWCFLPMPFASQASMTLSNGNAREITVQAHIDALPSSPPGAWGHLHAHHHLEREPAPADSKYRLLDAAGRGKHVGTMLFMSGHKNDLVVIPNWYPFLEGDETIVSDGELAAQGTGTEDYFNGGWYFWDGLYSHPFGALIDQFRDEDTDTGKVSVLRWHVLTEGIRFDESLTFDFEYGPDEPELLDEYSSVAYYYLR